MKHWIAGVLALGVVHVLAPLANAGADVRAAEELQVKQEAPKGQKPKKKLTDAQIRQILIEESIAAYSGNCPCPYNRASNGSRCGRRSAYDREGGAAPLCFPKDVSADMVQSYRAAHVEE